MGLRLKNIEIENTKREREIDGSFWTPSSDNKILLIFIDFFNNIIISKLGVPIWTGNEIEFF